MRRGEPSPAASFGKIFLPRFDLSGRSAVVTGALGKIGKAIALALAEAGAEVVGIDTQDTVLETAGIKVFAGDAANPARAAKLAETMDDIADGYAIWVNAAYPRTADWGQRPGREDAACWTANVTMQMTAACVASEAVAFRMARRGGGSIVNVASIYGMVSPDFSIYAGTEMGVPAPYSAIKGGLINHTRYLAGRYGRDGVRVNVLAPGGVAAGQPGAFVTAYNARTALGRMGSADDMAGPAVFLASDAAQYVTGVCLPVDGGWTAI